MTEPKRRKVNHWLVKAFRDLETARKSLTDANPFFDVAIYHC